jgi:putative PIN family toxin of toxin-antitoxin system
MADPRKVVPDTGFILQATLSPLGPASRLLWLVDSGEIMLYLSYQTREEIEDVLSRQAIREKYPRLDDGRVEAMLRRLDEKAQLVTVLRRFVEFPRDLDDEPVLNVAIHVQADYLVSRDKDLLDLGRSRDFRMLYPFLRIIDPVSLLQEIHRERESLE